MFPSHLLASLRLCKRRLTREQGKFMNTSQMYPGAGNSAVSQNLHFCSILTRNNKNFQR